MRTGTATVVALLVVAALILAAAAVVLSGPGSHSGLQERWVSDTARERTVNHHAPAAGMVGDLGMVYAPVSAGGEGGTCELVALHGENGTVRWSDPVPAPRCTLHSVADPTIADYDGDGVPEVLATTTEDAVFGHHPLSGEVEFRGALTDYGYSRPVVTDLDGDGAVEVVVVDVAGTVAVYRPDGRPVWERRLSAHTLTQPAVADFDGDGSPELAVGFSGSGNLTVLEADGTTAWTRARPAGGAITWMTTADAAGTPGTDLVVATSEGVVAVVDGRDGAVRWRRDLGTLAAVHAVGDGDGDGDVEVYAVAQDAVLRSYTARDGTVEWTTTLTSADVQMTPPPVLADLDGDGDGELVAATNDGTVSVVDPASGEVLATYGRDVVVWVHPTLADVTGDGAAEAFVMYGDGRVVSLTYAPDG